MQSLKDRSAPNELSVGPASQSQPFAGVRQELEPGAVLEAPEPRPSFGTGVDEPDKGSRPTTQACVAHEPSSVERDALSKRLNSLAYFARGEIVCGVASPRGRARR